ncbi:LOW QUALITY PROTEIN: hypothetical protein RJ640_005443 [Escallonia rubra]|uniref:Uncharacterized protein n=1 Tax=Escallonia rubra TaxID=112253 RepID=A0AA88RAK5_9ASTE|nr:LOW QUALITY PROTEIN: hypothetical protein RJ640_005443 [Escallonia rubra]
MHCVAGRSLWVAVTSLCLRRECRRHKEIPADCCGERERMVVASPKDPYGSRSLEKVWVAVLNITCQISSWSLANNRLLGDSLKFCLLLLNSTGGVSCITILVKLFTAPEIVAGGPPSYICRLSGATRIRPSGWRQHSSADIRIDVAVVHQYLMESAKKLKGLFPDWVDVIAYSSFLSTYKL